MPTHPLIIVYILMDAAVLIALAAGLKTMVAVVLETGPTGDETGDTGVIQRGRALGSLMKYAFLAFGIGTIVFIATISEVLPGLIPGAKCGTGVLQASDGFATRATIVRVIGLILLAIWFSLERTALREPRLESLRASTKALLVALPIVCLAAFDSVRMLWKLDLNREVGCCKKVMAQVSGSSFTTSVSELITQHWLVTFAGGTAVIGLFALITLARRRQPLPGQLAWAFALFVVLWTFLAVAILKNPLSTYHFGEDEHYCLWCLFLGKNNFVGYPIFLLLFTIIAQTVALILKSNQSAAKPRTDAGIMLIATVGFFAFSMIPALMFRWEFGFWMD